MRTPSRSPRVRRVPLGPLLAGGFAAAFPACAGSPPETLGAGSGRLAPCPATPNCVHTGDRHPEGVQPFLLSGGWAGRSTGELAAAVEEAATALPRTRIVHSESERELYLHAEARSPILRFVDDLEVYHASGSPEIVVRSASRLGRSDLGVNARRVEELRGLLAERGVVDP